MFAFETFVYTSAAHLSAGAGAQTGQPSPRQVVKPVFAGHERELTNMSL